MNTAAIVTARLAASRLPRKMLAPISGEIPAVAITIRRAKLTGFPVILCIPDDPSENELAELGEREGVKVFRGALANKIARWHACFAHFNLESGMLVDGDDLSYSFDAAKRAVELQRDTGCDVVMKGAKMTDGLFTYLITRRGIDALYDLAGDPNQNTDVIIEFIRAAHLAVQTLDPADDAETREIRLTLDYQEDVEFYQQLYTGISFLSPTTDLMAYALSKGLDSINIHKHREFLLNQSNFNKNVRRSLSQMQNTPTQQSPDRGWRFTGNERKYIDEVLSNGFRAGSDGAFSERFEALFAERHGQKFGVAFNSGTGTLHAILAALGVSRGDEVAVPSLVPAMCGFAPAYLGATPLFVDVRPDTFLMDADDLRKKITSRTKAIMVVHIYGLMCDMDAIEAVAKERGIPILEDCAQCFLATDDRGRLAGTIGVAGSWSLEASKHLCSGEGGIVCTNDEDMALAIRRYGGLGFKNLTAQAGKVRIGRDRFQDPDWERHAIVGYNYRMSELTAAMALAQTERMDEFVNLRMQMGGKYFKCLSGSALLQSQAVPAGYTHSYYTFGANFKCGETGIAWQEFRKKYIENGGDGIYAAWRTLNNEPAFRDHGIGTGAVPVAESLQKTMMQFTTNQATEEEQDQQIEALTKTLVYFGDHARK